jgi:hypothetical protein
MTGQAMEGQSNESSALIASGVRSSIGCTRRLLAWRSSSAFRPSPLGWRCLARPKIRAGAKGSGIPDVEAMLRDKQPPLPLILILVKFFGGVQPWGCSHGLGPDWSATATRSHSARSPKATA